MMKFTVKSLIIKNNNLSKDEQINIKTDDNNTINLKAFYLNKISKLKKNVNFYKNQDNYNELLYFSKLNEIMENKLKKSVLITHYYQLTFWVF